MPSNRYPFIAQEAWPFLLVVLGMAVLAQFFLGYIAFVLLLIILLLFAYLFRDPSRAVPSEPLAVVSPIHGVVTLIEEAEDIRLHAKTIRVQITMRLYDIYSLRSPMEGKVVEQWCSAPDKHESHRHIDLHIRSDEGDNIVTAIRLRDIVRKFHLYMYSGERVGQGQRCGYLYFGGVVDVFLPLESKVRVEVGQYVQSGSTVLANLIHSEAASVIQTKES
ncbi:MAG: phosphatidylserine decarboxylase [Proteobacteria bacterium]|nr:phosphatidylserine decarboxylase [Pseudomonadota bacterium]NOG60145.1 phosphatidylserine decarboxylase [Pseudomonadota bacterium]